tara:strand:+ start:836 stop:1135 length:300 start_codon:yes stop_codon:yes gene_type:complete
MLGILRNYIERFDLRKFPHEYPDEMLNYKRDPSDYYYGHLNKYFDVHKGYFSFYDLTVYIIVGTFLAAFVYTVFIQIKEKEKGYMIIVLTIICICALLY